MQIWNNVCEVGKKKSYESYQILIHPPAKMIHSRSQDMESFSPLSWISFISKKGDSESPFQVVSE